LGREVRLSEESGRTPDWSRPEISYSPSENPGSSLDQRTRYNSNTIATADIEHPA